MEPKKLVSHGDAVGRGEATGSRRPVHTIARAGRCALHDWVLAPPAPPSVEAEIALKVPLAAVATRADLLSPFRRHADTMGSLALVEEPVIKAWMREGLRCPQQARLPAAVAALRLFLSAAFQEWSVWAERLFDAWENPRGSEEKLAWATEVYRSFFPVFEQRYEGADGRRESIDPIALGMVPDFPLTKRRTRNDSREPTRAPPAGSDVPGRRERGLAS